VLTKASTVGWLNYDSRGLRSAYPSVKTMIVSRDVTSEMRQLLCKYWDYVFDYSESHHVMAILKAAVGRPAKEISTNNHQNEEGRPKEQCFIKIV
jgi:hypothetical protein